MSKTKILALIDYKNRFGSKHFDEPYRSGMDKEVLRKLFAENGYDLEFNMFHDIDIADKERYSGLNVIYTSSEDIGYHYKSYIEDVVLALETVGANIIPNYLHLRANNNKVFMEVIRSQFFDDNLPKSNHFGSLIDLLLTTDKLTFPLVLKSAEGASGAGVFLVKNRKDLIKKIKRLKDYLYLKEDIKDYLRPIKHKGYQRESRYRKKFIIQDFIPELKNDWKVYVFGDKIFVFNRPIQKGRGIRASGGGYDNYFYGLEANTPSGMFDFAYNSFKKLKVPHASLDIAYDEHFFYLIEFQTLFFGTAGIPYSNGYFSNKGNSWEFITRKCSIEEAYCSSLVQFLEK
ncbi:RimK family alpha-L-glutamate ligase [Bacteroidota bacterium]